MITAKITAKTLALSAAVLAFSFSAASAGPCNTANKDAGSGNVPGYTGQTTGKAADTKEHPPTAEMNKAAGNTATSSQDTQRQMQGQPTASQQAQDRAGKADEGC